MADPQRTHKATPKRVREFRKRGEIALSRDLVSAATFAGAAIALIATGGSAVAALGSLTRDAASAADGAGNANLAGAAVRTFLFAVGPVLAAGAVCAIVAILGQLGWPPAFRGLKLDFGKLSPVANLRQVFGLGGIARRSGSALAKLAIVGAVVAVALSASFAVHPTSAGALAESAGLAIRHALELVIGALLAIAAVDYLLARRRIAAQMKMTPDELKRELREQEGDPMVRGRRRQKMKELAKRRIAVAVKTADVVVVNPTHYAVALRYEESSDRAPVVVAKGIDELAEKIREVARQHGVPVLSRPPLARALHKHVKEGQPIPSNLYRAVAEVLAYVYKLRGRK